MEGKAKLSYKTGQKWGEGAGWRQRA